MSGTKTTVASSKGVSTLVRARFGPGMLLQHEDLEQVNAYTRELSRLLFRSLFGCGVVCGLVVKTSTKCGKVCVTVGAGVALDGCGDPIQVPKDQTFAIDEDCNPNLPTQLWVVLCGNTKCCAPRTSVCASDDDEAPSVCTRERDGFEIRVVSERPECICGCPEPEQASEDPKSDQQLSERERVFNSEAVSETPSKCVCRCVDPEKVPCYADHYAGKCGCNCDDGSECGCECILLARMDKVENAEGKESTWTADHRVRRFIRPVLMRDPQVGIEENAGKPATNKPQGEAHDEPEKQQASKVPKKGKQPQSSDA
jgi:hypothetical protein